MKNLLLFSLLILICFTPFISSQAPDGLWTKTFGGEYQDWGSSIQQTSDGGYIIAGTIGDFSPNYSDIWLLKTDANGDTLWTKTFGGSDYDWGNSVQQTLDGGYIIAGNVDMIHPVNGDVWLIKTNANGDTLWTKTFGEGDYNWGNSVQQTSDGGYIITGLTLSFGAGSSDVWVIKTNKYGDTIWTKTLGGGDWDWGNSVT